MKRKTSRLLILIISVIIPIVLFAKTSADYAELREEMVEEQIEARGVEDTDVLEAMRNVPRHQFVPESKKGSAYQDNPLSIGYGQTISQPYIVAYMTELLELEEGDKVLEIGTGSGYQAAVLAEIVDEVYTVEIIEDLAEFARDNLEEAGYEDVTTTNADGYYGWEEHSPYDAIIVTAAAEFIPPPLIEQLKVGGKMCIPIGPPYFTQTLNLVTKNSETDIQTEVIATVAFVPFTRASDYE